MRAEPHLWAGGRVPCDLISCFSRRRAALAAGAAPPFAPAAGAAPLAPAGAAPWRPAAGCALAQRHRRRGRRALAAPALGLLGLGERHLAVGDLGQAEHALGSSTFPASARRASRSARVSTLR